jgi:hypothetical protein
MNRSVVILLLSFAVVSCSSPAGPPTAPAPPGAAVPPVASLDDDGFIKGTVRDTVFRPLAGARVEVLDGPLAGTAATVDASGEFSIIGTFDEGTRFRASKENYLAATGTLQPWCGPCHPHRWIHFELDVPTPPVSLAGDYTLTFVADSVCTSLPAELRTRTYDATIAPLSYKPDTAFEIIVSGTGIEWQGGGAGVSGNFVVVGFGDPGLVEEVAPLTYLTFYGVASASVPGPSVSTFTAPFDGVIDYCVLKSEPGDYFNCNPVAAHATCGSKNHRLTLTRR